MRRAEDGEQLLLIGVAMGRVMTIRKDTATHEAKDAARAGRSLNDACPYPFLSEAGRYFRRVYDETRAQLAKQGRKA